MSYLWCDDPYEHKRQAERDFHRGGRYGYDREKYHDRYGDECHRVYADHFDTVRREEDRREEERREEEDREQRRQYEIERQRRDEYERDELRREEERYEEEDQPVEEARHP